MYQINHSYSKPKKRRRLWLGVVALVILMVVGIVLFIRSLKPDTVIHQSPAHTGYVTISPTTHYQENGFSIDLPTSWKVAAKPIGDSQSYIWQSSDTANGEQSLNLYEDTVPVTFPIDRLVVVAGEGSKLSVARAVSPACTTLPAGAVTGKSSVSTTWQGIRFLCFRGQRAEAVVGTGSGEAINTVTLKSPKTGTPHSFFFTYVTFSGTPDYTVFYDALASLRLQ